MKTPTLTLKNLEKIISSKIIGTSCFDIKSNNHKIIAHGTCITTKDYTIKSLIYGMSPKHNSIFSIEIFIQLLNRSKVQIELSGLINLIATVPLKKDETISLKNIDLSNPILQQISNMTLNYHQENHIHFNLETHQESELQNYFLA